MKVIFVDTGYWHAILNPKDNLHAKSKAVSSGLGKSRLLTTEMVLDELMAALSHVPERAIAIRGVEAILRNPNVEVVPQTSIQFRDAFEMYKKMADKEWSLTDCASFAIMQSRGISEALAHDHHFEQAGFTALLRD
ncbi:MAG: PIN domain-containing protein [Gammaproteobacteria bacterium]|nr:PIN domain-containing protein [Gammaproteobacteria bacterium]